MKIHELHDALDDVAGPAPTPFPTTTATFLRAATRRRRQRLVARGGVAAAVVALVAVGAVVVTGSGTSSPTVVAPAGPSTTASIDPAPVAGDGSTVTAIGDGVMGGAVLQLADAITNLTGAVATIDSAESRQPAEVLGIIETARNDGRLGNHVIIHTGTNGTITPEVFDQLMGALADVPRVVVVNDKVPRPWETRNNEVFAAGVPKYRNAVLVDWHAYGLAHPELFYDDGIHLRPEGATAYAKLVAAALDGENRAVAASSASCGSHVTNRSGLVVGCLLASNEHLTPPERDALAARSPYGEPVHDLTDISQIVGYIGSDDDVAIGFVPAALVDRYQELKDCGRTFMNELEGTSTEKLTDDCKQLMTEQGVPRSQLEGH